MSESIVSEFESDPLDTFLWVKFSFPITAGSFTGTGAAFTTTSIFSHPGFLIGLHFHWSADNNVCPHNGNQGVYFLSSWLETGLRWHYARPGNKYKCITFFNGFGSRGALCYYLTQNWFYMAILLDFGHIGFSIYTFLMDLGSRGLYKMKINWYTCYVAHLKLVLGQTGMCFINLPSQTANQNL